MLDKDRYRSARPRLREYWQPRYWSGWMLYGLLHLFAVLPQRMVWVLGAILGDIVSRIHRTTTIRTNLAMCFPELDERARESLRRRYYRFAGRAFVALGFSWFGSRKQYERRVRIRGSEHVDKALADGKGVLFMTPHFLFLEAAGIYVSTRWPMIGVYRKPRNPMLHQALRHAMSRHGGLVVERYESFKPIIRAVRDGYTLYYLPDQDPDRSDTDFVFAPFFGQPAATYTAFARLAKLTGAAVIPLFSRIRPGGQGYEIEMLPPLENFPTGDDVADASRINEVMERAIRETPEQYLWSYRRFKTRPDGAPSPYGKK
ncbi:MAG: lysophospholipid acyltransferase family protein [Acidiferrobacteraceae bacterium]|jgi:KDO2-lipid IV(A) lauroyltransferase